ncbi:MAG: response regulator [Pyrinomonadaceae bacterium]
MSPISFFSIEEEGSPSPIRPVEPVAEKTITFLELDEAEEPRKRTELVVETERAPNDGVNFFGISVEAASEPSTESKESEAVEANNTVMIVEDDNIVSTMLKHILVRKGFEIEVASDGRKASEMISNGAPPALVILDVMLPFVDGFELIRKIRSTDAWQEVPVIMLTAKTREEDIVRALEAGANDYVVKPFQPQELIARVNRHVNQ